MPLFLSKEQGPGQFIGSSFFVHPSLGLTSIEAIGGEHVQLLCCNLPICFALEDEHGGGNFPLAVMVAASIACLVSAVDDRTWMAFVPFFPMSVLHGTNMEWVFGPY